MQNPFLPTVDRKPLKKKAESVFYSNKVWAGFLYNDGVVLIVCELF